MFVVVMHGAVISGDNAKMQTNNNNNKKNVSGIYLVLYSVLTCYGLLKFYTFSLETFAGAKVMAALTSVYKSGI